MGALLPRPLVMLAAEKRPRYVPSPPLLTSYPQPAQQVRGKLPLFQVNRVLDHSLGLS